MTRNIFKSIGAILIGILLIVLLDTSTDMVLQKLGIFPGASEPFNITWMVLLAVSYRTVFAVIGSWATAAFAPSRPMFHALIIGIIGLLLNVIGYLLVYRPWETNEFSLMAQQTPSWYAISLAALSLPSAWLGGKLKQIRATTNSAIS